MDIDEDVHENLKMAEKPGAPRPVLKTSPSPSPPGVRTDSKPLLVHDSSSCALQLCSGHGGCVPEGKETRCHCDDGYEGDSCDRQTSNSPAPLVLGLTVLVIVLAVAVFLYKKRYEGEFTVNKFPV